MSDKESRPRRQAQFRKEVADNIIKMIEDGTLPWTKPWISGGLAVNGETGRRYKGINCVHLGCLALMKGYTDPRWGTFKQIQEAGGRIRKGEHGARVEYWKFEQVVKDEQGNVLKDDKGEAITAPLPRPYVFYATVFNYQQADGLPPLEEAKFKNRWRSLGLGPLLSNKAEWSKEAAAELIVQANQVPVFHDQADACYYSPAEDAIHMVPEARFPDGDSYYGTLLHEVAHSTGATGRLNREFGPFGDPNYAKEELRAEIASYILSHELGIHHNPAADERHAAYVGSWLKALRNDPDEISRAARDAEMVCDYLYDREVEFLENLQENVELSRQERNDRQIHCDLRELRLDLRNLYRLKLNYGYYDERIDDDELAAELLRSGMKPEAVAEAICKGSHLVGPFYADSPDATFQAQLRAVKSIAAQLEAQRQETAEAAKQGQEAAVPPSPMEASPSPVPGKASASLDPAAEQEPAAAPPAAPPPPAVQTTQAPAARQEDPAQEALKRRMAAAVQRLGGREQALKLPEPILLAVRSLPDLKSKTEFMEAIAIMKTEQKAKTAPQDVKPELEKAAREAARKEAEQAPATDNQKAFAAKLGVELPEDASKAQASKAIYKKTAQEKAAREAAKEEAAKAPASEKQKAFAAEKGVELSADASKAEASKLITEKLEQEKAAKLAGPPSQEQLEALKAAGKEAKGMNYGQAATVISTLPATEKQKKLMADMNISFEKDVTRGQASRMLDDMKAYQDLSKAPATDKQKELMEKLGLEVKEGMTIREAGRAISKAEKPEQQPSAPATEKQKELMEKLGIEAAPDITLQAASQVIGYNTAMKAISEYVPEPGKAGPSFAYRAMAKKMLGEDGKGKINDAQIAGELLKLGYKRSAVANTLQHYSPNVAGNAKKAAAITTKASAMPSVRKALESDRGR